MKTSMRLALVLSMVVAGSAHATLTNINGYICSSMYTKQNHVSFGNGYVNVQVYTGARCSGTYVGDYYFLSSGATVNGYQFSEAERLQMFERTTLAATQGTRVNLFVETNGGGIFHTTFYGN